MSLKSIITVVVSLATVAVNALEGKVDNIEKEQRHLYGKTDKSLINEYRDSYGDRKTAAKMELYKRGYGREKK